MNKIDAMYVKSITDIMHDGSDDFAGVVRPTYKDGTPSHTKFITQSFEKYDISKGEFPITTLRPIAWKSAIKEILWIYQYESNDLEVLENDFNISWWNEWNIGDNTIGQRYGSTVNRYDLMTKLLTSIKENPYGRRHIMSLWQEYDFRETKGLLPCAYETLWSVRNKDGVKYLDMTLVQRSNDYLVAGHINKIQYVALMMMVARHCRLEVGIFSHYTHNLHIYDRHFKQAEELIERFYHSPNNMSPKLVLNPDKSNFYNFDIGDFEMIDYKPMKPQLKFELGI